MVLRQEGDILEHVEVMRLVAKEFEAYERVASVARGVVDGSRGITELRRELAWLDYAIENRKAAR